jgi:uncharacterized protein
VADPLPPYERRVLGVLIEKQKTSKSADAYPMTLNSITTGCNQKSNRDPVYDLGDDQVEGTLGQLQRRGLVSKITGGRADRWRHLLYEAWRVSKVELAVLAELLLRGPQSEGDLRGRAGRMDDIKDLDELRAILKGLADRRLVVYLTPPDRRGAVLTHGFHAPAELDAARAKFAGGAADFDTPAQRSAPAAPAAEATGPLAARLNEAFDEIGKLKDAVGLLTQELVDLRKQLGL